ncbi:DUF2214 family protein [Leptothoe sp. ISB3NOV94-8A]|nr:DUF2214 family protein [Adonisia turfae]MDV3349282.1 DUF2214 family protein [Leptothoe sp. LEGE 181152]
MIWKSSLVAYLHYASFMLIFAALSVEGVTLKKELSISETWKIVIADGVYGISATVVLITGVLRVLYFSKGADYYLSNPVFYAKVAIFVAIGTLSLYPTFSFLTWIKDLRQGNPPSLELSRVNQLAWIIKIELLGFILIPLLAAMMARGVKGW